MAHEARTDSLTVRCRRNPAVNDVSIIAPGGSVTAIVGPNGAGKSSVLLAMYGSVQSSGRVLIDGDDVSAMRTSERAHSGVALVPQGRQLSPASTYARTCRSWQKCCTCRNQLSKGPRPLSDPPHTRPQPRRSAEWRRTTNARRRTGVDGDSKGASSRRDDDGIGPADRAEHQRNCSAVANEGVAVLIAEPSIGAVRGLFDQGYVLVRSRVVATDDGGGAALDRAYQAVIGVQQAEAHQAIDGVEVSDGTTSISDRVQPRFPTPP